MNRLKRYRFRDENGHPLENCVDFQSIFTEHRTALEAAEAEHNELETYISKLVYALTDGKLSKPYDISVITDEVENIYQEHIRDAVAEAEAENARLRAERDWLAQANSGHCGDKLTYDGVCRLPECAFSSGCLRNPTADDWTEAARRAVAGEGESS